MPFVMLAAWTRSMMLRRVSQGWRLVHLATRLVGLEATNRVLQAQAKRPLPLSAMWKSELVDLAYAELQMTQEKAKNTPVVALRHQLGQARRNREIEQYDPVEVLPSGFQRMKHADLCAECTNRDIEFAKEMKRAELMQLIIVQVEAY